MDSGDNPVPRGTPWLYIMREKRWSKMLQRNDVHFLLMANLFALFMFYFINESDSYFW